jgi:hypothetical protein
MKLTGILNAWVDPKGKFIIDVKLKRSKLKRSKRNIVRCTDWGNHFIMACFIYLNENPKIQIPEGKTWLSFEDVAESWLEKNGYIKMRTMPGCKTCFIAFQPITTEQKERIFDWCADNKITIEEIEILENK